MTKPRGLLSGPMIGLFTGPTVFLVLVFGPALSGLSPEAQKALALALLMAIWWATEAIPIPVTALLPILLLPSLNIAQINDVTKHYGHPIIFLFMGGFILARAMERWGLHKRMALHILCRSGQSTHFLIGGFMLASALISMWVTNTATTMMMLPIGLSVIEIVRQSHNELSADEHKNFATALLLGLAYAATIGGLGTLIGTVPNSLLAAYATDQLGIQISFVRWMAIGVPTMLLLLPLCWIMLTRYSFPLPRIDLKSSAVMLRSNLKELGTMSVPERSVALIFVATALSWTFRPLIDTHLFPYFSVSDTSIAIAAAIVLFLVPVNLRKREFLIDWDHAKGLPWGLLLMFGGGLALASAIRSTGLAESMGMFLAHLEGVPTVFLIICVAATTLFITEVTSNTATTATFLPVMAALAAAVGVLPLTLLVPTAIAASCAFMLPVATPPNAIVYGSGRVDIADMMRAGFSLNIIGILILTLLSYYLVPILFS